MSDLSVTAASVLAAAGAGIERGTAGATITAGQVVYKEASTGKFKLTDTDHATAEVKNAYGIALNGASNGQPLAVCTGGDINVGATLTPGVAVYASNGPGGMCLVADVATENVVFLGIPTTASNLRLQILNSGVAIA